MGGIGISVAQVLGVRPAVYLSILALVLLRLAFWRAKVDDAYTLCSELVSKRSPVTFEGSLVPHTSILWRLDEPVVRPGGSSFYGQVYVDSRLVRPVFGRRVLITGPFRCQIRFRNPGEMEDGISAVREPRVIASGKGFEMAFSEKTELWTATFQNMFRGWLEKIFQTTPRLLGLLKAVWMGDTEGLPPELLTLYREGGLLQVLALSGQHVGAMLLVFEFLLQGLAAIFFRFNQLWLLPLYRCANLWMPMACSSLLLILSGGAAPIQRTFVMVLSMTVLRFRGFECTPLQITASAVACMILWRPSLACSPSFVLSVVATGLLCQVVARDRWRKRVSEYFFLSSTMPVLVFPLSAFFFAKISWFAPLSSVLMSWVWDCVLLPFAFAAPFIFSVLPRRWNEVILPVIEKRWDDFVTWHYSFDEIIHGAYHACIRPTWSEFILVEVVLLCAAMKLRERRSMD